MSSDINKKDDRICYLLPKKKKTTIVFLLKNAFAFASNFRKNRPSCITSTSSSFLTMSPSKISYTSTTRGSISAHTEWTRRCYARSLNPSCALETDCIQNCTSNSPSSNFKVNYDGVTTRARRHFFLITI